jgi:hypothetical protein
VPRLLATLLVALLLPKPDGATLVVLVPSADGLVVAADSRISMAGKYCDGPFKITQLRKPDAFQSHLGGEIFSVVIASYDPKSKVSTMRNFVVRLDARTDQLQAGRFAQISVAATDRRGVWAYGETAYLEQDVHAGARLQFLSGSTLGFILDNKPVADTPLDESVAAAVNVIQATSRATEIVPAPRDIGGPIRVVVLGVKFRPRLIHWESQ